MQNVIPALRVLDYAASQRYYVERLGFHVVWEHRFGPAFPVFARVERDGMALFLTEHAGDCEPGGLVHIYVPDVDAWHAGFQASGADVEAPPSENLPGLRMMTVRDPDGNRLRVVTNLPA